MYENAEEELLSAGVVGASAQGGAQLPFVLGESAFNVNPIPVDVLGEPTLQVAAVLSRGPFPGAARVDGDDRGADSDLPAELVMQFAVVGHVGEDAAPPDSHSAIQEGGSEFGSVVARSLAHAGGQPQVGRRVTKDGELGIGGSQKPLRVGPFASVVDAHVPGLVAGGVERPFGLRPDQAAAVGSITDRIEESIEAPFFRSRL